MNSLEKNVFYNSLLTTYRKRYNEATDKCYIICIPVNDSYDLSEINDKFISAHILKPSPLLKSHFVASNNKHNFDVEIEGKLLRVTRGFGNQNHEVIHIIGEEVAYNYQNKEYRILICENPLINSSNRKLHYDSKNSISQNLSLVSFEDCQNFLKHLSSDYTDILKSKVEKLSNTYIVLPNYIEDAANRIKVVIDWGIDCFASLCALPDMSSNESFLESAIESYVIGLAYPKLFSAIKKRYAKEDGLLFDKFVELSKHSVKPVDFGAQKALECFTINSIISEELVKLESKITPLEKLNCLRRTLDLINEQMIESVDNKYSPLGGKYETICIMSDDLIAAVICVLTAVKLKQFASDFNFIQTFSWNLPRNNEFGYSLVTFEVAKEFIKNYNINQNSSKNGSKEDIKSETEDISISGSYSSKFSNISSPLDRELEKISKMIDSSIDLDSQSSKTSKSDNIEDLGEFLGSMSQNSFSVGFGKQF